MRFATAAAAFGLAVVTVAHPIIEKRALSENDTNTLQLALYLEHLELQLYTGGFENFTDAEYTAQGFPAGFRENVGVIAQHEATHVGLIQDTLTANGVAPVENCTYTFPYSDPTSFVDLANMITSVGIGAFLGGATPLSDNAMLLTTASSILSVEARHDSYLRAGVGGSPFPNAFDTTLSAPFAYSLAQMFIESCPQGLPLTILPKLNVTAPPPSPNLTPVPAGTTLDLAWDPSTFFVSVDPKAPLYIAMVNQVPAMPISFTEVTMTGTGTGTIPVPQGVSGAAFAVLTTFSGGLDLDALTAYGSLAGPAEIIVS